MSKTNKVKHNSDTSAETESQAMVKISSLPHFAQFTGKGLILKDDTSLDDWSKIGEGFGKIASASQWALGDWLNFGAKFEANNKKAYGEAILKTGIGIQQLRTFASIAKRFPEPKRNELLSFEHHRTIAPVKSEEKVLALMTEAVKSDLSVSALRAITPKAGKTKGTSEAARRKKLEQANTEMMAKASSVVDYLTEMPKEFLLSWQERTGQLSNAIIAYQNLVNKHLESLPTAIARETKSQDETETRKA